MDSSFFNQSNLCIITDCVHYSNNNKIGNKNNILIKQFDELFKYFEKISICCPLIKENNHLGIEYYKNENIDFYFLPVLGGNTILDKIIL